MFSEKLIKNLKVGGFAVKEFETSKEALEYLDKEIDKKTVSMGGSVTLDQMGVYEKLNTHNEVIWHWRLKNNETVDEIKNKAINTQIYITSANAISENGEIVNIDGSGNRISATTYGHEKVYFVVGKNKVTKDLESAIFRARNTAAPMNTTRLKRAVPCVKIGRCVDCKLDARACRGLLILFGKMNSCDQEVILINEDLGY